jgi:hypothetical protein
MARDWVIGAIGDILIGVGNTMMVQEEWQGAVRILTGFFRPRVKLAGARRKYLGDL